MSPGHLEHLQGQVQGQAAARHGGCSLQRVASPGCHVNGQGRRESIRYAANEFEVRPGAVIRTGEVSLGTAGERLPGIPDPVSAHLLSSTVRDSTWEVWGNISINSMVWTV